MGVIKHYRLFHRVLKEWADVEANSAQEACENVGWLIGDVWVREWTPVVADSASESGHRGGGWRNITPRERNKKERKGKHA